MPAETSNAPNRPIAIRVAAEAGTGDAATAAAGITYCTAAFTPIKHGHNGHTGDQRQRNAALGIADFAAHHVEVVPAVIGPKSRDQRSHKAGHSALGAQKRSTKVSQLPVVALKSPQ